MSRMVRGAEYAADREYDVVAEFAEIAQKHRRQLLSYAWRMTAQREEAEDIVQEALLKAFRALPRFRGDARMDTWLYTIVRNATLEHLRKRKVRGEVALEPQPGEDGRRRENELWLLGKSPEDDCEQRELEGLLRSGMDELTIFCRLAIQLCVLEEQPYQVVASHLNISVGSLKSRVFHGKRTLRRVVQRHAARLQKSAAGCGS